MCLHKNVLKVAPTIQCFPKRQLKPEILFPPL